jgi:hypothetical protein
MDKNQDPGIAVTFLEILKFEKVSVMNIGRTDLC